MAVLRIKERAKLARLDWPRFCSSFRQSPPTTSSSHSTRLIHGLCAGKSMFYATNSADN